MEEKVTLKKINELIKKLDKEQLKKLYHFLLGVELINQSSTKDFK